MIARPEKTGLLDWLDFYVLTLKFSVGSTSI
jgi:hypothetical protein